MEYLIIFLGVVGGLGLAMVIGVRLRDRQFSDEERFERARLRQRQRFWFLGYYPKGSLIWIGGLALAAAIVIVGSFNWLLQDPELDDDERSPLQGLVTLAALPLAGAMAWGVMQSGIWFIDRKTLAQAPPSSQLSMPEAQLLFAEKGIAGTEVMDMIMQRLVFYKVLTFAEEWRLPHARATSESCYQTISRGELFEQYEPAAFEQPFLEPFSSPYVLELMLDEYYQDVLSQVKGSNRLLKRASCPSVQKGWLKKQAWHRGRMLPTDEGRQRAKAWKQSFLAQIDTIQDALDADQPEKVARLLQEFGDKYLLLPPELQQRILKSVVTLPASLQPPYCLHWLSDHWAELHAFSAAATRWVLTNSQHMPKRDWAAHVGVYRVAYATDYITEEAYHIGLDSF